MQKANESVVVFLGVIEDHTLRRIDAEFRGLRSGNNTVQNQRFENVSR
jgi:hypothetical protein